MVPQQRHTKKLSETGGSSSKSTACSNDSNSSLKTGKWVHTTTKLTLGWLFVSIPLVIWDIGFVLLRPMSMPGGSLHWPLWVPYELYARTDYIYGWKALNDKNGFTSGQGSMNVPETLLYIYYLYLIHSQGVKVGEAREETKSGLLAQRHVAGQPGALAIVIGFTAVSSALKKITITGFNEAFSGWSNVGHNKWINLVFLWIIPNGAWLIASAYMTFAFGKEILRGLSTVAEIPLIEEPSLMKEN